MTPTRRSAVVRAGVYAAVLFLSWNFNLLGLPDGVAWSADGVRCGALGSEAQLVVARLARPDLPTLHPLGGVYADGKFVPYTSQFGLTGVVFAALGLSPAVAAALMALFAAAVVGAVFAGGQRWLGAPAGDLACALAAACPVFLPFAPSLYWAFGLMLLPFALVWCLGPRATTPGRRALLAAAVGGAVLVRCLCGYEYVTAVILAPAAAAWFHQHRAGESLRARLFAAVVLGTVGVVGFAGAMGLHVVQLNYVLDVDGVAVIRNRAAERTSADAGIETESRLAHAAKCFWNYFHQPALSANGGFGRVRLDVPLKAVAALALALAVAAALARNRLPVETAALAGAVVVGFGASVSWQVLAVNHMCVHDHLNRVVFAVPFLPLAFLLFGHAAGRAVGAWVGPSALALVAAAMAANAALEPGRRAAERAEQEAAEVVVAAGQGGGRPASGSWDTLRPAGAVPGALLVDYGWLDPATGGAALPDAVVATGWVLGPGREPARVVAVVDGRVVPCDQLRFRRPDVDAALGRRTGAAGFVVRVPAGAQGEVRLLAATGGGAMVELTAPK